MNANLPSDIKEMCKNVKQCTLTNEILFSFGIYSYISYLLLLLLKELNNYF